MTAERTALESALIPVTAYILIACIECYRRYPDMMRGDRPPASPEELGAAGRLPGSQIDAVHLWSIANIPLLGRQVLAPFGLVDLDRDVPALATVLDFWKRAAGRLPRRWGAPGVGRRVARAAATGRGRRRARRRVAGGRRRDARAPDPTLNAALTSFLFLLYFDTRAGYQDTGPYPLADGRVLLVRDFTGSGSATSRGARHLPPTCRTRTSRPRSCSTATCTSRVTDWGTSITDPPTTSPTSGLRAVHRHDGKLAPVAPDALDGVSAAVKDAQRNLYRRIAGMSRQREAGCRRVRVLHVPAAVRRSGRRRRQARLDRSPRQPRRLRGIWRRWSKMPDVESDDSDPVLHADTRDGSGAVIESRPADEGRHEPRRRPLLERVVVLRLLARRRHRRVRPARAVPQPAGRLVLGVHRVARARARRRARPRGAAARAATRSRSGRTASGPSACARRRWSTGAWGSRPSACGSTRPATPTGARSANGCPSGSTWSGRHPRPSTTTRIPTIIGRRSLRARRGRARRAADRPGAHRVRGAGRAGPLVG